MPQRRTDRPPGTQLYVPGYSDDLSLANADAVAFDQMQDQFSGPLNEEVIYDMQIDQFSGRLPRYRKADRPKGARTYVPGYLSDEAQSRLDQENLGIAPVIVAGAVSLIGGLLKKKSGLSTHFQRYAAAEANGQIATAKTLIDQAYAHTLQNIKDKQDWINVFNAMQAQTAIPELQAYINAKLGRTPPPTVVAPKPPSTIAPPAPRPPSPPPSMFPSLPSLPSQPPATLPGGGGAPGPIAVDYGPSPADAGGGATPAPAGGTGLMTMFSGEGSGKLALIGGGLLLAFSLMGGGGRRSRR